MPKETKDDYSERNRHPKDGNKDIEFWQFQIYTQPR